jgi:hypothetical protein
MQFTKNWTKPTIEVSAVKLAKNGSKSGPADATKVHAKS